jgi:hypothetical protein
MNKHMDNAKYRFTLARKKLLLFETTNKFVFFYLN